MEETGISGVEVVKTPATNGGGGDAAVASLGPGRADETPCISVVRRCRRAFYHGLVRAVVAVFRAALWVGRYIHLRPRDRRRADDLEILLTGTFYSDNWVNAHIRPLAASRRCGRLYVVSTHPIQPTPKVVAVYPPGWLVAIVGRVPARLLVFCWMAVRRRPDIIGGFHLLVNGMVAAVVARFVGARSMYFCVGGPAEVVDGGIRAENRLFGRMETPDHHVERGLLRIVSEFDIIITMGARAASFLQGRGTTVPVYVVPGGIDAGQFSLQAEPVTADLILVGRLVEVKRIDVFLEAVSLVARRMPDVTVVVVGDGVLRDELTDRARRLRVDGRVRFVGQQSDVGQWLRRSRLFVLTSDSEGLALSLMEAMTCGLPAVVSNVGDLADLVQDGVNGYLVERRSPEAFADRIIELLADSEKRVAFSRAALRAAKGLRVSAITVRWDAILAGSAE